MRIKYSLAILLILLSQFVFWNDVVAQKIAAGWAHSLFVCNDKTAMSSGYNGMGQLGNGSFTSSNLPVAVSNLTDIKAIGAGGNHSIALKYDSTVWCWGYNSDGQLGDGTNTNRNIPVQTTAISGVTMIAGGVAHNLALRADSTVWTWGNNTYGQLGDGTINPSSVPVTVSALSGIIDIAGGSWHSIALKSDSTVWTWGNNQNGELGDGTTTASSVPVQVLNLTGIIAVSAGQHFSMALKSDGTVWTWGNNSFYQLGNGTTTSSSIPVQVSLLTGVISIAKGSYQLHSLAIRNDSTLWTWGLNDYGALGNGTLNPSSIPLLVNGINDPSTVAVGNVHSIALLNDGTLWIWGWNFYGQLGNAGNTDILVPIQPTGLCQMPVGVPSAVFIAPNDLCPGICIDFTNLSTNATTFVWSFPGASPSSSTDPNPQNICYPNSGNYDVQLIASNSLGSDTLLLTNYITVFPPPPPQGILQSGDTLFANTGATAYQWYYNGNLIAGATDYFYVAPLSGDYNVVVTDANGCEAEAVIFNVIASLEDSPGNNMLKVELYPNPAINKLVIKHDLSTIQFIKVYDEVGQKVMEMVPIILNGDYTVELDVSHLAPGNYFVELCTDEEIIHRKFLKSSI